MSKEQSMLMADFSKIKTGGTFLTNVVGSEKVFCKELFSDEEKMIYEAMRDFATNEFYHYHKMN